MQRPIAVVSPAPHVFRPGPSCHASLRASILEAAPRGKRRGDVTCTRCAKQTAVFALNCAGFSYPTCKPAIATSNPSAIKRRRASLRRRISGFWPDQDVGVDGGPSLAGKPSGRIIDLAASLGNRVTLEIAPNAIPSQNATAPVPIVQLAPTRPCGRI